MPKVDLTTDEITQLAAAVDSEIRSAKRQQNTSKTPQIKEVWNAHERVLEQLKSKLFAAK